MEEVLKLIEPLISLYAGKLGFLAQVISIVGTLRLLIKPLQSIADTFVALTPSPKDNEVWERIKASKWYSGICYFLDWFASLKLKK